jgi:hypothetical protein
VILPALLLALSGAASAADSAWTVAGDSSAVLGGEAVIVYRPSAASAAALTADTLAANTTSFAVVKAEARSDGSWAWTVVPLNVGALEFTARWTQSGRAVAAPPALLAVAAPPVAKDADIADIKGPVRRRPWWPLAAAAALLAAATWWAWKRWKNRPAAAAPAVPAAPLLSPEAAAESALTALAASGLWERGEHAAYYLRLTDVLRIYLEARYGEPASAMTSVEVARLVRAKEPDLRAAATVREVLGRADLVKFARSKPDASEGPNDLGLVRALILATTPAAADAAAAPAQEADR